MYPSGGTASAADRTQDDAGRSAWDCDVSHLLTGQEFLALVARDPSPVRLRVRLPDSTSSQRYSCPFPQCHVSYSGQQGVCTHIEQTHKPLSTVPQRVLESLNRWTCCDRLIPMGKACRQCHKP